MTELEPFSWTRSKFVKIREFLEIAIFDILAERAWCIFLLPVTKLTKPSGLELIHFFILRHIYLCVWNSFLQGEPLVSSLNRDFFLGQNGENGTKW